MPTGPEPDSFQKMVRWLILAFFVYVCVHSYFQKSSPLQPQPLQTAANAAPPVPDCDKKKHFPLSTINFFPLFVPTVHDVDTKPGSGEAAFCGQRVKFTYEYSVQQKVIGKGEKTATIGGGDVPHGVELALIGMKPGGTRRVDIPSQLAGTRNKTPQPLQVADNQSLSAKLSLLEASPPLPVSPFSLHIMNGDPGEGMQVNCGDRIRADITIWKLDGTVLFSTPQDQPATFIIGNSDVPLGIEQAAISMSEGSERIVILPPGGLSQPFIKRADDAVSPIPALPDEITVVQIENVHIADPKNDVPTSEEIKAIFNHKTGMPAEQYAPSPPAPKTKPDASSTPAPSDHP